AFLGTREADLCHTSAYRHVAADEGGTAGGAALLAVVVGKRYAFAGKPIDVGRHVAHHAAVVVADIPSADVVAPDDEDIRRAAGRRRLRLLRLRQLNRGRRSHHRSGGQRRGKKDVAPTERAILRY